MPKSGRYVCRTALRIRTEEKIPPRLTQRGGNVNILSCRVKSAENGKVAPDPKNREGPSPAERGPAAEGVKCVRERGG